jgi:hypothetical protein
MVVDPDATVVAGDRNLLRREVGADLAVQNTGAMEETALDENGRERELFFWWGHKKKKKKCKWVTEAPRGVKMSANVFWNCGNFFAYFSLSPLFRAHCHQLLPPRTRRSPRTRNLTSRQTRRRSTKRRKSIRIIGIMIVKACHVLPIDEINFS